MSNHERVYEGTLNWPLALTTAGLQCVAPAGEGLPPWGLSEDDEPVVNPCNGEIQALVNLSNPLTISELKDLVEEHMREAHGEEV